MTQQNDPIDLNADSSALLAGNDKNIENTIDNINAASDAAQDAKAETDQVASDINGVAEVLTDAGQVIKTAGI